MPSFVDRLKSERERIGLTQAQLAKSLHKGQSFIGNLESGARRGTASIPELAHALGVDAYWLKTGRGHKHGQAATVPTEVLDLATRIAALPPDAQKAVQAVVSGQEALGRQNPTRALLKKSA